MHPLQAGIERLYALGPEARNVNGARGVFGDFRESLTRGERSAPPKKTNGEWKVNVWVKQGICWLPTWRTHGDGVRRPVVRRQGHVPAAAVPHRGQSPHRAGRIVGAQGSLPGAPSVICMPPMYINVGAYVDEEANWWIPTTGSGPAHRSESAFT